jgi:hypothetical protein
MPENTVTFIHDVGYYEWSWTDLSPDENRAQRDLALRLAREIEKAGARIAILLQPYVDAMAGIHTVRQIEADDMVVWAAEQGKSVSWDEANQALHSILGNALEDGYNYHNTPDNDIFDIALESFERYRELA